MVRDIPNQKLAKSFTGIWEVVKVTPISKNTDHSKWPVYTLTNLKYPNQSLTVNAVDDMFGGAIKFVPQPGIKLKVQTLLGLKFHVMTMKEYRFNRKKGDPYFIIQNHLKYRYFLYVDVIKD